MIYVLTGEHHLDHLDGLRYVALTCMGKESMGIDAASNHASSGGRRGRARTDTCEVQGQDNEPDPLYCVHR